MTSKHITEALSSPFLSLPICTKRIRTTFNKARCWSWRRWLSFGSWRFLFSFAMRWGEMRCRDRSGVEWSGVADACIVVELNNIPWYNEATEHMSHAWHNTSHQAPERGMQPKHPDIENRAWSTSLHFLHTSRRTVCPFLTSPHREHTIWMLVTFACSHSRH